MKQERLPGVERFFQFALLGLVASGYLAIVGSGSVDAPTVILAGIGLIWRAAIISGARRLVLPDSVVTVVTIAYMAFAPFDYFFLASTWIAATVHVVFFVAGVKILTARTARDYLFVAAVAFLELLAAAVFSSNGSFFVCLTVYLGCAVAALAASEVRRLGKPESVLAKGGLKRAPWGLAGVSLVMTAGILVLTAGLFFILPRTANAALRYLVSNRYHLTGFSNDVMLGEVGELKNDSRPVMHVKPLADGEGDVPAIPANMKWRGLALERFDGRRWSTNPAGFRPLPPGQPGLLIVADDWQRRRRGPRITYQVEIQNVDADALFVGGIPEFLSVGKAGVLRDASGAFRVGFVPSETVRYEVISFLGPDSGVVEPRRFGLTEPERDQDLRLPLIDSRIAPLAQQMTAGALSDRERARRLEQRLRHDYAYSLELPKNSEKDPLASFLFIRRRGYCEYFASSMTVMLRTLGIPARLVNGFQSGIVNPYTGTLVIRASDAHTWVEAFLPESGWTVFDPTPSGAAPAQTLWSRLALYADAADTFWREWVLTYDVGHQLSLASKVETQARRFGPNGWIGSLEAAKQSASRVANLLRQHALGILFAALGIAGMFVAVVRLRRLLPARKARSGRSAPRDATLLYSQMLGLMKKRGFQKPAWFTPLEFADSAPEELETFTAAYNRLRFGGRNEGAIEMVEALEKLTKRTQSVAG